MIKVLTARFEGVDLVRQDGELYTHLHRNHLKGELLWDGKRYRYDFLRDEGFTGDCASSPDIAVCQAAFPTYVSDDPLYNIGADAHDWLYAVGGELTQPMLAWTRSECDDFLRGVSRESPTMKKRRNWVARLCCGAMDLLVGLFAGGGAHWKNDTHHIMNKATMTLTEA